MEFIGITVILVKSSRPTFVFLNIYLVEKKSCKENRGERSSISNSLSKWLQRPGLARPNLGGQQFLAGPQMSSGART